MRQNELSYDLTINLASHPSLTIHALWDEKAGVWSASSDDVIGLAIEAETREGLINLLKEVVPELLELNHASP